MDRPLIHNFGLVYLLRRVSEVLTLPGKLLVCDVPHTLVGEVAPKTSSSTNTSANGESGSHYGVLGLLDLLTLFLAVMYPAPELTDIELGVALVKPLAVVLLSVRL